MKLWQLLLWQQQIVYLQQTVLWQKKQSCRLLVSSGNTAKVEKKISKTLIVLHDFSLFSAFSAGTLVQVLTQEKFHWHSLFCQYCPQSQLLLVLSLLPPAHLQGPLSPLPTASGAVLWYWSGATSTVLKYFPQLSYFKLPYSHISRSLPS